jgi:hypothetical protein
VAELSATIGRTLGSLRDRFPFSKDEEVVEASPTVRQE